ncbi:MAG: helix-turn-helix domain-containing protein [Proteobacteria bacterium]|nr:helix-turn-helix domain-containing protein [Pseudomonadota bacterium]
MSTLGRPTLYAPEFCEPAHNYCLLGATNEDLAGFFHVCTSTIDNWLARHADFAAAVKRGRAEADARVARCLYDRAVGYEQRSEREVVVQGQLRTLAQTIHHPPNVQACIFWLRNRRPRDWRVAEGGSDALAAARATAEDLAALDAAGERARAVALARRAGD